MAVNWTDTGNSRRSRTGAASGLKIDGGPTLFPLSEKGNLIRERLRRSARGEFCTKGGGSMVNGQWSMVNGQRSTVNGQRPMCDCFLKEKDFAAHIYSQYLSVYPRSRPSRKQLSRDMIPFLTTIIDSISESGRSTQIGNLHPVA